MQMFLLLFCVYGDYCYFQHCASQYFKEIRKLTFRALALRRANPLRKAKARNDSFRISLQWLIYIVNSVDNTKLSCNTPTDAAPQFLQKLTPFMQYFKLDGVFSNNNNISHFLVT